jgi:hypothetical protein
MQKTIKFTFSFDVVTRPRTSENMMNLPPPSVHGHSLFSSAFHFIGIIKRACMKMAFKNDKMLDDLSSKTWHGANGSRVAALHPLPFEDSASAR